MITLGIKSPRTFYERTKKTPWAKMNSMRLGPQFVEVSWSSGPRVKNFNPYAFFAPGLRYFFIKSEDQRL